MRFLITGLNHQTAPLEIREKVAFDEGVHQEALEDLSGRLGQKQEILLLSTCNRTEILVRADQPDWAALRIRDFLLQRSRLDAARLDPVLYNLRDLDAVRHLFRVAASLDSMILGEPQILHQVKSAHALAARLGFLGPTIDALCQRTLQVAKRVRAETGIGRNPVSISYAACELARTIFGELDGCRLLVLGAGEMSELSLRHLMGGGARTVHIATRRVERAEELARRVGGEAVDLSRMEEFLEKVDIVLSSTAARQPLITREMLQGIMRRRKNRPIFFIDIAVPRDIEPSANGLDGVFLYDIDDLQRVVDGNMQERRREAARADDLITQEVESYHRWFLGRTAGPTISALREHLHEVRRSELERFRSRHGRLDDRAVEALDSFSRALVNKILHQPTTVLRRAAEKPSGVEPVEAVRRLFGIEPSPEPPAGKGSGLRVVPPAGKKRSSS